jgi:NitT/TauT family transport system permease protein
MEKIRMQGRLDDVAPPSGHVFWGGSVEARRSLLLRFLVTGLVLALVLLVWILLAARMDPLLVPEPTRVWNRFTLALQDGTYLPAVGTTAEEACLGWLLALVIALPLGYLIGLNMVLEDALAPVLASSQAMPIVAIAPLLVVWLGFGILPKVIVCCLIAFFPILATTSSGIRSVSRDLRDAARVFGAGPIALAWRIDLPLAARTMFAGIKVAAALSVTGAVVGEFVSSDQGLGYLVNLSKETFDTPLLFVALISLMLLGAGAYSAVSAIEHAVIRWED